MHRLLITSVLAFGLAGTARAEDPLPVLSTVAMIADIAEQVGGDCVQVTTMISDGSDPHLYRPTPSDVRALQEAELILYGGHNLEGQLAAVLGKISQSRRTVALSEVAVSASELILSHGEMPDPHVWMSPKLWAGIAPVIALEIQSLRPDCTLASARASTVVDQLAALNAWVRASIETIPEGKRHLVTAHDAFAYFARDYGLQETAIQGLSTAAEASIADIDAVADVVVQNAVPAVFVESTVNPRTIEAMIEAVEAKGASVKTGGELYSDAMGPKGSATGTYIGMIHHNTQSIVTALGGTVAPLPDGLSEWANQWGVAK